MESMSSLIRTLPITVAPVPAAAILRPQAVAVKGGGTGLRPRPLLPPAGPLVIPGPALALVATEGLHVVAVKTTPGMAVGGTAARRPVAPGPAIIPTPGHPPQTDTGARDSIGPAPSPARGHQAIRAGVGTGAWLAGTAAGFPDLLEAVQSLHLRDAPSI